MVKVDNRVGIASDITMRPFPALGNHVVKYISDKDENRGKGITLTQTLFKANLPILNAINQY